MQKLLGLDVGTARIGVAAGDDLVKVAHPLTTLTVDGCELTQIQSLAAQHGASLIVVGLPRNASGEETQQSQYSRHFAEQLTAAGLTVALQDESLTSITAEQRLQERKKPYTKADIDAEAATIILQDYLEAHA
jgi:putative Holliday junction resolvase